MAHRCLHTPGHWGRRGAQNNSLFSLNFCSASSSESSTVEGSRPAFIKSCRKNGSTQACFQQTHIDLTNDLQWTLYLRIYPMFSSLILYSDI
jgi:hypothetical protein